MPEIRPIYSYIAIVAIVVSPFAWYGLGLLIVAFLNRTTEKYPDWSVSQEVTRLTSKGDTRLIAAGPRLFFMALGSFILTVVSFITAIGCRILAVPENIYGFSFVLSTFPHRVAMMRVSKKQRST